MQKSRKKRSQIEDKSRESLVILGKATYKLAMEWSWSSKWNGLDQYWW